MAWSWNKYREACAEAARDRELREKFPDWERQLEERTRNLQADLRPVAEPVPTEPAIPPPAPKAEQPTRYPWDSTPDSD